MSSEPEAEPTTEPEPTSEPEPTVEPEAEPEVVPESEPAAWSEPEPEWSKAFGEWGPAWHIHVYTFGCVFMIMAVVAFISMLYFLRQRQLIRMGRLTFSLQILCFVFTSVRALTILLDPYATTGILNGVVYSLMWSVALPGLTASFSVLLLVLLDTTKMTLGPPRFQKLSTILIFTAVHFIIVITSSIVFLVCNSCKGMLVFCQILFILYGALLGVGYAYSSRAIYKNCSAGQGFEADKISRLSKIAALASVTSFSITITYIYMASSVFGLFSDVTFVDSWDWWILQTGFRLQEVIAIGLVLLIAWRNPFPECRWPFCKRRRHRIRPASFVQHSTNDTITIKRSETQSDYNAMFSTKM